MLRSIWTGFGIKNRQWPPYRMRTLPIPDSRFPIPDSLLPISTRKGTVNPSAALRLCKWKEHSIEFFLVVNSKG
ncbi:MAG: hypothetical protein F6K26_21045 [Moorea sp. SIO2I5]|nr:hypothetical protein [Moorena sp. SIO2I5]